MGSYNKPILLSQTSCFYEVPEPSAEISALLKGIGQIFALQDFDQTARELFHLLKHIIGARAGYTALLSADGTENELLFLDPGGMKCTVAPDLPMPIRGLRAEAYATGTVVYENDFAAGPWQDMLPAGHMTLRNVLFAPLVVEGQAIGVFGLANKADDFSEHDARLAEAFGRLAAVSLRNAKTVDALKQSEQFGHALLRHAPNPIIVLNTDTSIRYVNEAFEELFGFSSGELFGTTPPFPWWTDQAHKSTKEIENSFVSGITKVEMPFQNKQGNPIWCEITDTPIILDNRVSCLLGTAVDITARKRAEQALRNSEASLESILKAAPVGIGVANNRIFTYVSDQLSSLVGYSRSELLGNSTRVLYESEEEFERVARMHEKRLLETGTCEVETRFIRKDGECLEVLLRSTPIDARDLSRGVTTAVLDITERKQAEEHGKMLEAQLEQARKMEAIGTLAGGVAHDFNNLMMGIQSRVSLMLFDQGKLHPDYEHLQSIEELIKKASSLTQQLLGFARGGKYAVMPTDMNVLLEKNAELFGRTRKDITIHKDLSQTVLAAEVDRSQIEQVLVNVLVNAMQAMPDAGELYLASERVFLDEDRAHLMGTAPGPMVKLTIRDTGIGMDAQTQARIFEPFFTTKARTRATGMGLASAYGIIKNHGGAIEVGSKEKQGTTVSIFLPASFKQVIKEKERKDKIYRGTETVLLVDDEEILLEVGKRLLDKLGYTPLLASSGKEALELFQQRHEDIDLVILDMIMPGIGGGETFDRMKKIDQQVKVLLSTGYSLEGKAAEIFARGCAGLIQKPFNVAEFSRKVRAALAAHGTG